MKYLIGTAILLCSILHVPVLSGYINGYHRAIAISALLVLSAANALYRKEIGLHFTLADAGWIGLIALSFISASWSTNPYHAIFGGFSTLLIYLCYKFFEGIGLSELAIKGLRLIFLLCAVSALGIISYSNFIVPHTYGLTGVLSGVNNHYLCSLILVVLPYLLIIKRRIVHFIIAGVILLGLNLIVYKVGSLQVFLCSLITILFLVVIWTRASMKKMVVILVAGLIIILIGLTLVNYKKTAVTDKFELFKEFDQQSTRIKLWHNSVLLFKNSPIVGVGKNNWKNEIGQFGYNDYGGTANNDFHPIMYNHAHNWFFQTISELGLIGLLCYLVIFLSLLFSLKKNQHVNNLNYASIFSILSYSWLGLMYGVVYNQFGSFQGLPIIMALGVSIANKQAKIKYAIGPKRSGIFLFIVSVLCLIFFSTSYIAKKKSTQIETLIHLQDYNRALTEIKSFSSICLECSMFSYEARIYETLEQDEIANNRYQKAIECNPYEVIMLYNYSKFLFQNNDYENAYLYASKVYKLAGRFLANKLLMIECLNKLGETEEVLELATEMHSYLTKKELKYLKKKRRILNEGNKAAIRNRQKTYQEIKLKLEHILEHYN